MDNFASGERQDSARVHQYIHTLCSKMGIKDSMWHLVFKYHSGLHVYIQTEMEFLEISSPFSRDLLSF